MQQIQNNLSFLGLLCNITVGKGIGKECAVHNTNAQSPKKVSCIEYYPKVGAHVT